MKKTIILLIIVMAVLPSLMAGGEKEYVREAAAIENEYVLADIEKTIQEETAEIQSTPASSEPEKEKDVQGATPAPVYSEVQMLQPNGFLPAFGMTDSGTEQEHGSAGNAETQERLDNLEIKTDGIATRLSLLETKLEENSELSEDSASETAKAIEKMEVLRTEFSSAEADIDKRVYLLEALLNRLDQDSDRMESRINALENQAARQEQVQEPDDEVSDDDEMGRRVMIAVSAFMSGIALMFAIKNITDKRF